ncbi:MAG: IclR family transcriptional regulator [Deltaproteobacteria bacterium]|nr:IclR family transcriptional regulator [Deltaproteobacteria bacterium]
MIQTGLISDSRLVSPLIRGMRILELLSREAPLSLEKISSQTGIPRTSVFRLLNTLEALGYAEREQIRGIDHWMLGLKLLDLTSSKLSKLDLRKEVRRTMEELAEKTDEFVQLGVLYGGKVMYIDHVKRPKPLAMYAEVGSQLPINVSAAGMVLAAALDDKELGKLLREQDFPANTPNAPTDPDELRRILMDVARQGFAIDDQQYAVGIRCIAAPILNHDGRVIAAINITGSLLSMTDDRMDTLIDEVRGAALEASKKMGYPGESIAGPLRPEGV